MKLLILYETIYPQFIGGVELRNHELAAALCRRGHEVTLAGFCGGLTSSIPNLRILSLGEMSGALGLYNSSGKRSTRQALRFAAVVRRLDLAPFDAVETPNMPYVHLLPLAWKCAVAGKPLLVTWYEYWGGYWRVYVGRTRAPIYRAIEWLTAQLGTAVNAPSALTRGRLAAARWRAGRRAADRQEDGQVSVIPCGITLARVRAAAGDCPGDGPPLIYAGRLLEHKRLDLVLRAVQVLAREETPAGDGGAPLLTVFGEGPDRERLEALAVELGIADRVRFRGHVKSSEEVWRELGRARLAVQPSAREGFGLFPLEAMAAGLPVVYCASLESAVGELVRDGVEGVEVAPEAGALAAALVALLGPAGEAERRRLSRNALLRAAPYDWDEVARRIEDTCLALIARRRR